MLFLPSNRSQWLLLLLGSLQVCDNVVHAQMGAAEGEPLPLEDFRIRHKNRPGNTLRRKSPAHAKTTFTCGAQNATVDFTQEPDLALVRKAAECEETDQITLKFPAGTAHVDLGKVVDEFLIDRFEWQIIEEPYAFQPHKVTEQLQVVVAKVPNKKLQKFGTLLRKRQFPAQCVGSKIVVMKDGMRFWGSMAKVWGGYMQHLFTSPNQVILAPFFPQWAMGSDTNFCGEGHVNEWKCYFLPMTNCPLPMERQDFWHNAEWAVLVDGVDPATSNIDLMQDVPRSSFAKGADLAKGPTADKKLDFGAYFRQLADDSETGDECKKCKCCDWDEMLNGFVLAQVFYRLNYRSRAGIEKIKENFFTQTQWPKGSACTTLHIRRTDKVSGRCLVDPNNPAYLQLPGFNRTFNDYMANSKQLMEKQTPPAKWLFVMTDDAQWVGARLEEMKKGTLVPGDGESIPQPEQMGFAARVAMMGGAGLMLPQESVSDFQDTYHGKRESKAHETHLFFASLQLAGSCRSLVVNSDSSIFATLTRAACAHDFTSCLASDAIKNLQQHREARLVTLAKAEWAKNHGWCRRLLGHSKQGGD
jgi:hypothetical protein